MVELPGDCDLISLPELQPDMQIDPPRRWWPSPIWAVPVLAALIGLSLVVQSKMQEGPSITVSFTTADGIEPGKTKVKYKSVDIGEVRSVRLVKDRSRVLATIELVKEAERFAVDDTSFWVVRPRFAGTGVSGLGTLLSGSYIGVDGGRSDLGRTDFIGLEEPPVVASDQAGRRFTLEADDIGSLDIGSPIYFRHIQVGHVERFTLEPSGRMIKLGIFVKSPYDHFVTEGSRFWHASGIDLSLNSQGLKLETQSLATILLGGIAFDSPPGAKDGESAADGVEFTLASNLAKAFKEPDGRPDTVVLRFNQSVRGLVVGATVDFRGFDLGHVRSIDLVYDAPKEEFSSSVEIDIYPERLVAAEALLGSANTPGKRATVVSQLVRRGLRAQLRSANFLTGQLYVSLDFFPDALPVRFDINASPLELPTIPADMEELHQQVQNILRKLERVPFDALGQDAHRTMANMDISLKQMDALAQAASTNLLPEISNNLREMTRTMQALQNTLGADAPMQQDTRQALHGVSEAARSLKALADALDRHPESLIQGRPGSGR